MRKNIIILSVFAAIFLLSNKNIAANNNTTSQEDSNMIAFLDMIQFSEGTYSELNPYAVTFGKNHTVLDFSDHPKNTGEWNGEDLADAYCIAANINPPCVTTAAGAYQFIAPTWNYVKNNIPTLTFEKWGQDTAAIFLIAENGAKEDVENGFFFSAITKLKDVWASFPDSTWQQPTQDLQDLVDFYLSRGGMLVNA